MASTIAQAVTANLQSSLTATLMQELAKNAKAVVLLRETCKPQDPALVAAERVKEASLLAVRSLTPLETRIAKVQDSIDRTRAEIAASQAKQSELQDAIDTEWKKEQALTNKQDDYESILAELQVQLEAQQAEDDEEPEAGEEASSAGDDMSDDGVSTRSPGSKSKSSSASTAVDELRGEMMELRDMFMAFMKSS